MSHRMALVATIASYVLCLCPFAPLRVAGAAVLGLIVPGWCFWLAVAPAWMRKRLDLSLAWAFVGSCAVVPLVIFWWHYGRILTPFSCATALAAVCLVLLGVSAVRQRYHKPGDDEGDSPDRRIPAGVNVGLAIVVVVFCGLILTPWVNDGVVRGETVSMSPCSGDWSFHRCAVVSLLDMGVPARNALLCYKNLAYYYGHFLHAAALVRLSGDCLSVEAGLVILSVILAAGACVLLFHLCARITGSDRAALAATAITIFVGGLDILVIVAARNFEPRWLAESHIAAWTYSPRVPLPFSGLHWAQHHFAASLLIIVLMWYIREARREPFWARVATIAVLTGAVLMTSVYLALVLLLAMLALYLVKQWRHYWSDKSLLHATAVAGLTVALSFALAGGMLAEMMQAEHNVKRKVKLRPVELPVAEELLSALQDHLGMPVPLPLHRHVVRAFKLVGGVISVVIAFGLVGILAIMGLRRHQAPPLWPPLIVLLAATAFCTFLLRNFDLQMRCAGLLWLLLAPAIARLLAGRSPGDFRRLWVSVAAIAAMVGLGSLAFEVNGMARPAYLDSHDMRVFQWVHDNTPQSSIVQAFPRTYPRIDYMPRERYWTVLSFPEFTGRCALMGDKVHVPFLASEEELARIEKPLVLAFVAQTPQLARSRFAALGVDYVLWTSGDEDGYYKSARSVLLEPACFEMQYQDGSSFVVRVLPSPQPGAETRP